MTQYSDHIHDRLSGSGQETQVKTVTGQVFDIQRYSTKDGPGVRTTVFLKGCPLRCQWCSNPESQQKYSQVMDYPNRRVISGKRMTPEEVLKLLQKDTLFYRNSGGGITLSGGEPTQQAEFAIELLSSCQRSGFHTILDTSGYCRWKVLQEILRYVDLVFFDIKHMDEDKHKDLTGVSNKLILENARRISLAGTPMVIRFPVIPGRNDSMRNIRRLGEYVSHLGIRKVDLLPYHQLALQKYEALGMDYRLREVEPPKQEKIRDIKNALESYGLEVSVVV